jgi:hypothetical protein
LFQNPETKDCFSIISNIVKGNKFLKGGKWINQIRYVLKSQIFKCCLLLF